jgi:hypothetical protein
MRPKPAPTRKKSLGLAFYCDRGDGVILRAQVNIYKNATEPSVSIAGALAYLDHTSAYRTLPEPESGPLEEHLLICTTCQDRLQATDDYVAAMRAAAKAPLKATKKRAVKKMATAPAPAVRRASGQ